MMKKIIVALLSVTGLYQVQALDIALSSTGSDQLDGIYRPTTSYNGATRYTKLTEEMEYRIERFQVEGFIGWQISDATGKVYFAVNSPDPEPNAEGWDVGCDGVGLFPYFLLTLQESIAGTALQATVFQNADDADVRIFPNPTAGRIEVASGQSLQRLSVVDAAGQVRLEAWEGNGLDLSALPDGAYFIVVEQEGRRVVRKIWKIN